MVYVFLMGIVFVALAIYALIVFTESPELANERFGELEALPTELGKWTLDTESPEAKAAEPSGLRREVRRLHEEGGFLGGGTLVTQARYKNAAGEIVRVDPEVRTKRKRVKR